MALKALELGEDHELSASNPVAAWHAAGRPILTDKAKAVLEAVEKQMIEECSECVGLYVIRDSIAAGQGRMG